MPLVEPLVGGNITGPAVNATVTGGIAYPPVYNNGTLEVPQILVWGTTTDGYPFFVQEMGIGSITQQVTRLVSNDTSPIHDICPTAAE